MQDAIDRTQLDMPRRMRCDKLESAVISADEYVNEASFLRLLSPRYCPTHKKRDPACQMRKKRRSQNRVIAKLHARHCDLFLPSKPTDQFFAKWVAQHLASADAASSKPATNSR